MGKILVLRPNEMLQEINVNEAEISLETLQEQVGGRIELFRYNKDLVDNNIDMFINEEGKLLGFTPNAVVMNELNGDIVDVLVGSIVFAGFDNEGNSLPLTDKQVSIIMKMFSCGCRNYISDASGNDLAIVFV